MVHASYHFVPLKRETSTSHEATGSGSIPDAIWTPENQSVRTCNPLVEHVESFNEILSFVQLQSFQVLTQLFSQTCWELSTLKQNCPGLSATSGTYIRDQALWTLNMLGVILPVESHMFSLCFVLGFLFLNILKKKKRKKQGPILTRVAFASQGKTINNRCQNIIIIKYNKKLYLKQEP